MTLLLEREPLADDTFIMKRADHDLGEVSDKQRGKQRLLDFDMDGEGVHEHDILCLPTAFLQCSIGPSTDEVQPAQEASIPNTTNEARGFDRLRYTAGMSAIDVQTMREQFHLQSGLSAAYTGDLIRQEDEQEYAYRLEEQWIDNMGTAPIRSNAPSIPMSILQGLLIGFFFPLVRITTTHSASLLFCVRASLRSAISHPSHTALPCTKPRKHTAPPKYPCAIDTAAGGASGTNGPH